MSTSFPRLRRPLRPLRKGLALVPFALALEVASAAPAFAQGDATDKTEKKDCPPGSWFCGDSKPPGEGLQPLPADGKAGDGKPAAPPPPVVVYQPPPATVLVEPREAPPAYYYVPRNPPRKKEWGVNLHLGGLMIGKGRSDNTGMGMVGAGLRFRPNPYFAIEGDLDFAGGRDYNGYRRSETSLAGNALLFLNPRSKAQVYFLAGLGGSWASATDDEHGNDRRYHYSYLGMQSGVGIEFRVSRTVALNLDLRGFIRGRTDNDRRTEPEFRDESGRTTNTSGGGLFQGGLTFYW